MTNSTERKICLITGATAGIGKACAEIFAENGFDLIITGRRHERLLEFTAYLADKYECTALPLNFDVRDRAECEKHLGSLPAEWSEIDVLINNAGLASGRAALHEGDVEDWERMIDTNVKGLLYVTRLITPGMVSRGRGHVINIGSIAGKEVYPDGNVYCATKFAVRAISKSLRLDLVSHGVKVTDIQPGLVETEFSIVRFHGDEEKAEAVYAGLEPLTADDIASTVWWVASQPKHVCIDEVQMTATAQGDSRTVVRSSS